MVNVDSGVSPVQAATRPHGGGPGGGVAAGVPPDGGRMRTEGVSLDSRGTYRGSEEKEEDDGRVHEFPDALSGPAIG